MSGATCIFNPNSPNGAAEALLWTPTSNGNVAVEVRNLESVTYTPFQDRGTRTGPVKVAGKLSSAICNRTVTVFGITEYEADGKTQYVVSSISPAYNPIQEVSSNKANPGGYNSIAAAGDGVKFAWVYFLKDDVGSPQKPIIHQCTFNLAVPASPARFEELKPDPSSDLAVALHPRTNNRIIFFQQYKNPHIFYSWSQSGSGIRIEGTNNSLKGTAIAASLVPFDDGTIEVYLYYIDNVDVLYRVTYSGTDKSGIWSAPAPIFDASKARPTSGLTVVADVKQAVNHVYYVPENEDAYTDAKDPFRQRLSDKSIRSKEETNQQTSMVDTPQRHHRNGVSKN